MRRAKHSVPLRGVQAVVRKISTEQVLSSLAEGELYICPTCNLPVKPCERHSEAICSFMVQENTQLNLLGDSAKSAQKGAKRVCALCGEPLSVALLSRNPLRELCTTCQSHVIKTQRGKSSSGV